MKRWRWGSGRGTGDVACHSPGTESRAYLSTYCVLGPELGAGQMGQPGLPHSLSWGRGLECEKEIVARTLRALAGTGSCAQGSRCPSRAPTDPLTCLPSQVARCQPGAGGNGLVAAAMCAVLSKGPPQSPASWASLSLPPSRYSRHPQPGLWAVGKWTQTPARGTFKDPSQPLPAIERKHGSARA